MSQQKNSEFPSHALKKKVTVATPREFTHPLQTWIYKQASLLVASLAAESDLSTFFKSMSTSSRLFFKNAEEFDLNISSCFLCSMAKVDHQDPVELIPSMAAGRAGYVLYNLEELYYVDCYGKVCSPPFDKKKLLELQRIFPQEVNKFIPPTLEQLDQLQDMAKWSTLTSIFNTDLIAEFGSLFENLKEINSADEFFDTVHKLGQFLFSPLEKSNAWESFYKEHKAILTKSSHTLDLIAGALTYKIMTFWLNKCQKEGNYDESIRQCYDALSKVCSTPNKKLFIEECKTRLIFDTQKQMSNSIIERNHSKVDKANLIVGLQKNLYYKLLSPDSLKICTDEIDKGLEIFTVGRNGLVVADNSIQTQGEKPNKAHAKNTSLSFLKSSLPSLQSGGKERRISDAKSSASPIAHSPAIAIIPANNSSSASEDSSLKMSPPKPELMFSASFFSSSNNNNTNSSIAPINPTSSDPLIGKEKASPREKHKSHKTNPPPMNAPQRPPLTLIQREPRLGVPKLDFENNPKNEQTDEPLSSKRRTPKHKRKPKEGCYLHFGESDIPATQMGEMTIGNQQYLFFAIPAPIKSTRLEQKGEEEFFDNSTPYSSPDKI